METEASTENLKAKPSSEPLKSMKPPPSEFSEPPAITEPKLTTLQTALRGFVRPSPPSALNHVERLAILYGETQDESNLIEIRKILDYVKEYAKRTKGMKSRERSRTITNPKWTQDIPTLGIYGMFDLFA